MRVTLHAVFARDKQCADVSGDLHERGGPLSRPAPVRIVLVG